MKRILFCLLTALFSFSAYSIRPALAQSGTPTTGPTGEVHGAVINRNSGKAVAESLEVMLHILDQDFAQKGMTHGQSQPDGTFVFADVPFDSNLQYAVMATYDGVTYTSDPTSANMASLQVEVEVPVYESTSDLTNVQVDQMHVLFGFAEDGLEIKEIYVFSNTGERTVKNVYNLGNDALSGTSQFATLQFPLPTDADYIFFKPESQDRFVKLNGGFADTYPILPGAGSSQIMVTYLVPYFGEREYTYTTPINISKINFLVPDQAGISLNGSGLTGPQSMDLQTGEAYLVYSYPGLNIGQTVNISIRGKLADKGTTQNANTPIAVGTAFLGFAMIGVGIWWWRRPENLRSEEAEIYDQTVETALDDIIVEIARLDEAYEQGTLSSEEYQRRRQDLMQRAKHIL